MLRPNVGAGVDADCEIVLRFNFGQLPAFPVVEVRRHPLVDFHDDLDESYELYGVSYEWLGSPGYYLRAGKYLNRKDVDYDWDIAGSATFNLKPINGRETYFHAWLHQVTEDNGLDDRDGFMDYAGEMGIKFYSGIVLFGRYEFLHDIDGFGGASDHHVLVGTRYVW